MIQLMEVSKKRMNDLHTFVAEEKHDFFLFNQTLEHVYNPFMVVKNIAKNLVEGGYVFTSVPTINIPHATPFNFSMWYPMGLATLFKSAGFEVLEIGQWGNVTYISKIVLMHIVGQMYMKLEPKMRKEMLYNVGYWQESYNFK